MISGCVLSKVDKKMLSWENMENVVKGSQNKAGKVPKTKNMESEGRVPKWAKGRPQKTCREHGRKSEEQMY